MRGVRVSVAVLCGVSSLAWAQAPAAEAVLTGLGFSADEVAQVKAGKLVSRDSKGVTERDLTTAFAFFLKKPPADALKDFKAGVMLKVDPNTLGSGVLGADATVDAFAKLTLQPDAEKRVKKYQAAKGGDALNLSTEEIAAFQKASDAAAVEAQVKAALLARYQAYRAKGLDGIAPYDREGSQRAVSDELKAFTKAHDGLEKYAPKAWAAMLGFPGSKVEGADSVFRWVHLKAHDVPTLALVHGLAIPDGDAWMVMQRQFYVSEGFNCEQAIAALLPAEGGTVVVYANHTSTDQVTGFGGGARRAIGTKLMAGEVQGLFEKLQKRAP
ncbi:MAG: hypothetical protein AB1938_13385 [Myxococcota bacterium]